MNDIVRLIDRMDATDAELEELRGRIATCDQAMILSRVAIGAGLVTFGLVFTIAPAYQTLTVLLLAFTAVLGGLVWLGANKSSRDELLERRATLDALKVRLFDVVANAATISTTSTQ